MKPIKQTIAHKIWCPFSMQRNDDYEGKGGAFNRYHDDVGHGFPSSCGCLGPMCGMWEDMGNLTGVCSVASIMPAILSLSTSLTVITEQLQQIVKYMGSINGTLSRRG